MEVVLHVLPEQGQKKYLQFFMGIVLIILVISPMLSAAGLDRQLDETYALSLIHILVFKIVSEAGIAAGVRRIEALTGDGVFAYYKEIERQLHQAAKTAKTTPAGLNEKIEHLQAEIRELHSENESLKSKMAKDALGDVMNQVQEIGGVKVLAARVDGVDMNGLRDLGDQLKEKLGEGVVVLASAVDGKVSLLSLIHI